MEEWILVAGECGFDLAAELNIASLQPSKEVRAMCEDGKCGAYGKNWTCPPACGTLEECAARMRSYRRGILLQTVGQLRKTIDTHGYRETERRHNESLQRFAGRIRRAFPDALCLGAGGCRICGECAYPEPCRFPGKAMSSMEGYGIFVSQVCRDNGMEYHYGPKTIAYTACVLFDKQNPNEI